MFYRRMDILFPPMDIVVLPPVLNRRNIIISDEVKLVIALDQKPVLGHNRNRTTERLLLSEPPEEVVSSTWSQRCSSGCIETTVHFGLKTQ